MKWIGLALIVSVGYLGFRAYRWLSADEEYVSDQWRVEARQRNWR